MVSFVGPFESFGSHLLLAVPFFLLLPLILLMKRPRRAGGPTAQAKRFVCTRV